MLIEIEAELRNIIKYLETLQHDIVILKKRLEILKLKNTRTKIKNTGDGFKHRLDTDKERIHESENVKRNHPE